MTTQAPHQRGLAAAERPPGLSLWLANGGRRALVLVVLPLLAVAAVAWAITARGDDMVMGPGAFVAAWVVMMAAMMLPAAAPVIALYALAARRGAVAAVPVFASGYLAVWALTALPAYAVARAVEQPLMDGEPFIWTKGECGVGSFSMQAEGLSLSFQDSNWIRYEFDWSND